MSTAARRIVSSNICSTCSFNILSAFTSTCGVNLRQVAGSRSTSITHRSYKRFSQSRGFHATTLSKDISDKQTILSSSAEAEVENAEVLIQSSSKSDPAETEDVEDAEELLQNKPAFAGWDAMTEEEIRIADEENRRSFSLDPQYRADSIVSEESINQSLEESKPWYLNTPKQSPAPAAFISPFIEPIPALPQDSPVYLEALMTHLQKDLGLLKFKIYDLRGIDPVPALGANIIMIICTARSGRHLHIASDKCSRYLRSVHKIRAFADGIVGRGELKLRQKRQKRKGKVLSEAEEAALEVGWVCVNTGEGVVVQILTDKKREAVDLEGLWERKLDTSAKRKAKAEALERGEFLTNEMIEAANKEDELEHGQEEDPEGYKDDLIAIDPEKVDYEFIDNVIEMKQSRSNEPGEYENRVQFEELVDDIDTRSNPAQAELAQEATSEEHGTQEQVVWVPKFTPRHQDPEEESEDRRRLQSGARRAVPGAGKFGARRYSTSSVPISQSEATRSRYITSGENLVSYAHYRGLSELYPRPRSVHDSTRLLSVHLNEFLNAPINVVKRDFLGSSWQFRYSTPFFESFNNAIPTTPDVNHYHIQCLTLIRASQIDPSVYSWVEYSEIPQKMMQDGLRVPRETCLAILRALATTPRKYRSDDEGISSITDLSPQKTFETINDTGTRVKVMASIIQKLEYSTPDLSNDPDVFLNMWLAFAPSDTLKYISTLAAPVIHNPKEYRMAHFDSRQTFLTSYLLDTYSPNDFYPKGEINPFLSQLNARVFPELNKHPLANTNLSNLPVHTLVVMTTLARGRMFDSMFRFYKRMYELGLDRPLSLFQVIFELLAREGNLEHVLYGLRRIAVDLDRTMQEKSKQDGDIPIELVWPVMACLQRVEKTLSDSMGEFQWIVKKMEASLTKHAQEGRISL